MNLEPRFEPANLILFNELEEIMAILFFTKGTFLIGYELNNENYFPVGYNNSIPVKVEGEGQEWKDEMKAKYQNLKFNSGQSIGAFEVTFH